MPPLLSPGDRCHVYEIVRALGTSGAAERYLVRDDSGNTRLLKIMAAPGAEKQRARFTQEGVALAKIAHANVVRVFGAGTCGDHVFLVIERFGEETLGDRLRVAGPPPLDDLLGWAQQVCSGLAEAHRQGIVHRNLTPESVVLGPGDMVKLGEFGMAKLASFGVVTTTEDQQIGSLLYMAPERANEKEDVGPRADLYALGILLYEAITGQHPAGPGPFNPTTAVSWHLLQRAPPLRERAPWVPADLAALVHQMMEKDPRNRPVSALEVHDRLRAARVGLQAPLLREVRNAARVERPMVFAPTQPMAATPGVTPSDGDRTAVLPAFVPAAVAPPLVAPPLVAPPIMARPVAPTLTPEAPGEVRSTGEPVASEARRPRPTSRWAAIGGGVLALAAAGTAIGWTLWSRSTTPVQGAASAPPALSASAPPVSPPAPTGVVRTAMPRSPGGGASTRPGAPAPRLLPRTKK